MRALPLASVVAAAAVSTLLPSTSVTEAHAHAHAPSDRGSVLEIRDEDTGEAVRDGAPKVCTFSLAARDFDGSRRISWHIAQRPADGEDGTIAETGTLTVSHRGSARTDPLSLADGAYTLGWRLDGERKSRGAGDFTVACGDTEPGDRTAAPTRAETEAATTPGSTPSVRPDPPASQPGAVSGTEAPRPTNPRSDRPDTPGGDATAAYDDTASDSPQPAPGGDDLAHSGADVSAGALATAAALLLGAGTYLTLRRRGPADR
ncbi:hypothetical protein [Streptomyces oceani]|uniref:Gram-positive cocci surface proteins LPxTG domain-containing protein n=1 Tax=Streptomyces oceani TaxID=1075402 RepID=A0A1E7KMW2_9ACTN|nr:hypothetical protein [Streptomyces oceani]OEV05312.1 hypothetical protein AN216_03620 [Streptomyces oceani]